MGAIKRVLGSQALGWLVRVSLGVLFVWASADKLQHPEEFAKIVNNYRVLPGELINLLAIILPWLELLCGLALIGGVCVRPAGVWLGLLLVVFIIAVSIALSKGINVSCGCFSTSSHARGLGFGLLLEDLGMLVLAVHAAVFDNCVLSVKRLLRRG